MGGEWGDEKRIAPDKPDALDHTAILALLLAAHLVKDPGRLRDHHGFC